MPSVVYAGGLGPSETQGFLVCDVQSPSTVSSSMNASQTVPPAHTLAEMEEVGAPLSVENLLAADPAMAAFS
jgi:hypothetical protein